MRRLGTFSLHMLANFARWLLLFARTSPLRANCHLGRRPHGPLTPNRRLIPRRIPLEHFMDHLRPFGRVRWFTEQTHARGHFLP